MRVYLPRTGKAFLPEVGAYSDALVAAGHEPLLVDGDTDLADSTDADVLIRFGGLLRPLRGVKAVEVHEYHSASTTRFPRSKNLTKSLLAGRPAGRIFMTTWVRDQFHFPYRAPTMVRDQGAAPSFFDVRHESNRTHDVVYAGSLSGRPGLSAAVRRLASAGATIALAGTGTPKDLEELTSSRNVEYFGQMPATEVGAFLARGRFGLNYCPDRYPWNRQFSTKAIEYLAAGLPIISNSYPWIEEHSREHGYDFIDLDEVRGMDALECSDHAVLSDEKARALLWPEVLRRCGFIEFLEQVTLSSR